MWKYPIEITKGRRYQSHLGVIKTLVEVSIGLGCLGLYSVFLPSSQFVRNLILFLQ